jgi:peptidoglycan/xylan/chitin deacetylase (PgdA/CDA1 family)
MEKSETENEKSVVLSHRCVEYMFLKKIFQFSVELTFDDGYLDHYHIARFLARRGIKATFFITTHLRTFEGKPLLTSSPKLIQEIHNLGHEIGSHSCTHQNLTAIPTHQAEREVKESREYLNELLGSNIDGFAYPGGQYNATVINIVRKYYKYARLGGRRFEDGWNISTKNRYKIGGLGIKELFKLPFKYMTCKTLKPVIVLHNDPLTTLKMVLKYLNQFNPRFLTLGELVDEI